MNLAPLSRAAVTTAALVALVAQTSCSGPAPASPAPATSAPTSSSPAAATIGAPGSACRLPVTFGMAESWKPRAVTVQADNPLAELARRGPLTAVCEIDAKPAGHLGFLRIYTGKGELRPTAEAFLGKDALKPELTDVQIAGRPAVEAVFQQRSQLDDSLEKERFIAVQTGDGVTAISLDSFDDDEHEAMLPAYELAKKTLAVT